MEITLKKVDHWLVLDLNGRVDAFNYELVTRQIDTLVSMGKKRIALDMRDVVFLSLQGLRFFSSVASRLSLHNGRFVLIDPPEPLMGKIELFNGAQEMTIVKSTEDLTEDLLPEVHEQGETR